LNDLLKDRIPSGRKPSSEFYLKAMSLAEKNQDAAMLFKLGQIADKEDRDEIIQRQMIKTEQAKEQIAQEKAERLKIENEIRRGTYMDREAVKSAFGKFYSVHTSQLQPIGLKLSDLIDSIPPGKDRRFKIQKLIDDEIFSALGSIQRAMVDWAKNS
jgi:ssDNA-specific exonuclease RecJ